MPYIDKSKTDDWKTPSKIYEQIMQENYKKAGGTPWLDFKHTVFGQLYEGFDVLDKIAAVKVGAGDKPVFDVEITGIEIEK